ncbi:hypothetical protein, partial [Leptospira borgpetersenii]|uniref:hypothetical protein n=1 Tax=Leptospira borgpetersenii TaxID=174 RepID=UPI001D1504BD
LNGKKSSIDLKSLGFCEFVFHIYPCFHCPLVHILSSIIWLEEKSQMDKEAAQVVSIKRLLFQKAIGFEMLRFYLDENAN